VLPEWLPKGVWDDWCAYRRQRKGWTRKAQELCIAKLDTLRGEGHAPGAVVYQSIERGWTGLFAVKTGELFGRKEPPVGGQARNLFVPAPKLSDEERKKVLDKHLVEAAKLAGVNVNHTEE